MSRRTALWCLCLLICRGTCLPADDYHTAESPLPPQTAAGTMKVPAGFQVTLFAGEPDVVQPISFCIDDRGRLWVAEAYSYPNHTNEQARDRILIFEDEDHDGQFDRRTVFYDKLNYVTGVEVGFGGAWVMSPPYFYFIQDANGDDIPDGPPEVLLDGFGNHANSHNLANGFAWGPDGWLYGTHGRTNWSKIGRPGTPDEQRQVFDGGVYRFHPVTREWEPYADGTTNPWGIDWDDYGAAFVCNCVNPHLFQVIPGAHYEPWRNRESSRYAYQRIDTIADHLHFTGIANVRDGLGSPEEDAMGGGHAHCGTMVYLGDNWPAQYRNSIFMNNIHGRRINNDLLRREGSGYTASHGPDIMKSQDPWFMGVTLTYGPDGSVFVSDWSDTGECHSVRNTRRETGRIYRISFGHPERPITNLPDLKNDELVRLQLHKNDWYVRHSRRLLQERASRGDDLTATHRQLLDIFANHPDVTRKLRALWALHGTGGLSKEFLTQQLNHDSEYVRAWAVTLLGEDHAPPEAARLKFVELASQGESPLVRLQLASLLQRLSPADAWPLAEALITRGEDAEDHNLPLMIWYGIEPLVQSDLARFVDLIRRAEIPLVRQHVARRVSELNPNTSGLERLAALLGQPDTSASTVEDILQGILTGLEGQRTVSRPQGWSVAYQRCMELERSSIRDQAVRLALIFDDPEALALLQAQALDERLPAIDRTRAIEALVTKQVAGFESQLLGLLNSPPVRASALRGLASYASPQTPSSILAIYQELRPEERQDAIQTLSSRKEWARSLLDSLEGGAIPRNEISAFAARQLRNLGDEQLTLRTNRLWGEVRDTSADRTRFINDLRKKLTSDVLQGADLTVGKELFQKSCANCHKLFGEGGTIGPDITGAQRSNLDYLLENLIDPSAAVSRDYQMQVIATTGGRVVTGLPISENEVSVTLQTATEKVVIPISEIEERQQSNTSMMPDGLLQPLSFQQIRDLLGYLQRR